MFEALGGQLQSRVQQVVDMWVWSSVEIRVLIYTTGFEAVNINDIAIYGVELMKRIEEWSAR